MARQDPEPTAAAVGTRIRSLRQRRGITLQELSDSASLGGRGNASNLEQGKVAPTVVTLEKVARALQVPMARLMPAEPGGRARLHRLVDELGEEDVQLVAEWLRRLLRSVEG